MAGTRIQLKRGDASEWTDANTVLRAGEVGLEMDTGKFKWGDGTTAWADLDYIGGGGVPTNFAMYGSNAIDVDPGAAERVTFDTFQGGDDALIDITDPGNPTVKTAGIYAITLGLQFGDGFTSSPGMIYGSEILLDDLDTFGPIFQQGSPPLPASPPLPQWTQSVTWYMGVGYTIAGQVLNSWDSVNPQQFTGAWLVQPIGFA